MKIFSSHRRKLEPRRRFGGREFRSKVKSAANYKRTFNPIRSGFTAAEFLKVGGKTKYLSFLFFAVLAYYLIISPRFLVSEINVSGNKDVSAQRITDAVSSGGKSRWFLIKKNNLVLLTQGRLNRLITQAIPTIKEVANVKRDWPNKISFEVVERNPGFVLESNNQYFLVDDEGTVISQVADPKGFLLVHDQITEDFALGEVMPNQKLATFVVSMSRQWNSKINVGITSVKFPGKSSSEVAFETTQGWSALFDTQRSVTSELEDLAVLLAKQVTAKDQPKLAYIDLRLDNRAYICFKQSVCTEQPQPAEAGTSTTNINQKK